MLLDRVRAKLLGSLSEWNMGCRPGFQALELIQTLRWVVGRCREWGLPLYEDIHAIVRETDGVEVSFQLEGVQSDPVELTNGLLQGDPPSPV